MNLDMWRDLSIRRCPFFSVPFLMVCGGWIGDLRSVPRDLAGPRVDRRSEVLPPRSSRPSPFSTSSCGWLSDLRCEPRDLVLCHRPPVFFFYFPLLHHFPWRMGQRPEVLTSVVVLCLASFIFLWRMGQLPEVLTSVQVLSHGWIGG